ncbi:hypothetical protein [Propionibacterium cyclohexanicum]|uniref:hypothetical protein n=1 Tax=Propionibacterium cyclohexanicum TaxID=64702 RepID=UPI00115FB4F6|nr:hypothetical protein [Propionibacterium cyclohexanicum]
MLAATKDFLNPQQDKPEGYVHGSAKIVTGLLVVACVLYPLTGGWGSLVALVLAIVVLLGRRLLENQAAGDFSDLAEARRQYRRTGNKEYLAFMKARCTQMLNDNKVLTAESKATLNEYLVFVDKPRGRAGR